MDERNRYGAGAGRGRTATAVQLDQRAQLELLWQRFWDGRDQQLRNELLLAYEPIVTVVVSRLPSNVRAYWDVDDLKSFGVLGLLEAIDRFETASEVNRFASYAMKRVRGAIFDELRRLDWLPRTVRRRVIDYRATVDSLSSELGREPGSAEVLAQMGVEGRQGGEILAEVQSAQLLHLHHTVEADNSGEEVRLIDLIVSDREGEPEPQVMASERIAEIHRAVTKLPDRQRRVVELHFLAGLTQEQIGSMLGVSNSRVCQIEASAMQTLRRLLTPNGEGESSEAVAGRAG